jgi:hypothetical protein
MKRKFLIIYEVEGTLSTIPKRITVEEVNEEKARQTAKTKIEFLSINKGKKVTILSCSEHRPVTFF